MFLLQKLTALREKMQEEEDQLVPSPPPRSWSKLMSGHEMVPRGTALYAMLALGQLAPGSDKVCFAVSMRSSD